MQDIFQLPIKFKGKDLEFPSQLLLIGYVHKIQVDVNGILVLFEPDEERNYRAYIDPLVKGGDNIDIELLKAITEAIEGLAK